MDCLFLILFIIAGLVFTKFVIGDETLSSYIHILTVLPWTLRCQHLRMKKMPYLPKGLMMMILTSTFLRQVDA